MHCYFLRPADIGAEVRYEVEVLRDGRGYSTRQVRGYQNGKPVYVCLASFAAGEPGGTSGRRGTRVDVPAPEDLPSSAAVPRAGRSGGTDDRGVAGLLVRRPQLRHAARARPGLPHGRGRAGAAPGGLGPAVRRAAPGRGAHRRAARPRRARLRVRLHDPRAGAARARPRRGPSTGLVTASLDHAMWFHRPAAGRRLAALRPGGGRGRVRPRRWPPAASSPRTARTWPPSSRKA